MDENSCVDETSKSVENTAKDQKTNDSEGALELEKMGIAIGGKASQCKVPNKRGSSCDTSGPSTNIFTSEIQESEIENHEIKELVLVDNPVEPSVPIEQSEPVVAEASTIEETAIEQPSPVVQENPKTILPNYEDSQSVQPRVRIDPCLNEPPKTRKLSIGPPPSYSFVMKQKKKLKSLPTPDPSVINRPPPPNYTNTRELFVTSPDNQTERICNLPSFMEPVWRPHSQSALCNRCGVIVLTTTHSHDSVATHVAALALCLFGCWPCCLLPYCMNVCKNIYHYCPICQAYLGLYTPW